MRARTFLLSMTGGLALGSAGLLGIHLVDTAGAATQAEGVPDAHVPHRIASFERIPNVPLTTHDGQEVRFYDDLVKDKTVAISFFYVACTSF